MTLNEKLRIYDLLLTNFTVGTAVPLSAAGIFLRSHEITPASCGFEKLLPMFQSMPEICALRGSEPRPGVPLVWYLTLLPRPAADEEAADGPAGAELPEEGTEAAPGAELPEPEAPPAVPAEEAAPADPLPGTMDYENVLFPRSVQNILAGMIGCPPGSGLPGAEVERIKEDYLRARGTGGFRRDEAHDSYMFPLTARAADGAALAAGISRNTRGTGSPWFVKYVGSDPYAQEQGQASRRAARPDGALRAFAFLGSVSSFLKDLAAHVQEEPWSFRGGPEDNPILLHYINYTFYRLQMQEKVRIADDGSFAAFNTGLQSRRLGEDVFAYFVPNEPGQESPWKFACFCSTDSRDPGERSCYKNMFSTFGEPEPATYFSKISDLLFDPACQVRLSSEHIFRDNCSRLPPDFLRRECAWNPDAKALLDQLAAAPAERREIFRSLGELITDDPDLFSSMNERLQGALSRTVKRIRRNYKLAVPCFFPTRGVMSMMLPISFTSTGVPTLVLVCERTMSGDYLGQTVLTLPMAYADARLLCRPGSEWLNTGDILASDSPELLLQDD